MVDVPSDAASRQAHWDDRYATVGATEVSWHERVPTMSLEVFDRTGIGPDASVIDVGGGASGLVHELARRGFTDLAVLDVSDAALAESRSRFDDPSGVTWIHDDLLHWEPTRTWTVWHDRAVFHFLTDPTDRDSYRRLLRRAVEPGGVIIVATFAADGPGWCSGLPVQRYAPDELRLEVGPELELLASGRTVHQTPAGSTQPFTWIALRR